MVRILLLIGLLLSMGTTYGVAADSVHLIGEFSETTTVDGHTTDWSFTLWRYPRGYLGTFSYFDERNGGPQCGLLRGIRFYEEFGDIHFTFRLSLGFSGGVATTEVLEFLGTVSDSVVSGKVWESATTADEKPVFTPRHLSLTRRTHSRFNSSEYEDYGSWLAAAELLIGQCGSWRPVAGKKQLQSRVLSVGITGAVALARGDGHELWNKGSGSGLDVVYSVTRHVSVGGRFALNRWTLDESEAVNATLPAGATLAFVSTEGAGEIFELTAMARLTSANLIGGKWTGFLQLGGGLYYLRFRAAATVGYNFDGGGDADELLTTLIDDSAVRGGANIGLGITFSVTEAWRLDLYPAYHFIFESGETTEYVTGVLAARLVFF